MSDSYGSEYAPSTAGYYSVSNDPSAIPEGRMMAANVIGSTVSATATARMKTYAVGNMHVPQQTRHARRIYVGGVPPNFTDEDGLRAFFNAAIAQGLGEENDHTYVMSVYLNQKKCFAFIEFKSIELAATSLELDGIMMKGVAIRILRANEFKPELIPPSMNKALHFDLSGFQFGNPVNTAGAGLVEEEGFSDRTFESLIQFGNLSSLEAGAIVIVGYPFDDNPKKGVQRGMGCVNAPKILRNCIRKYRYGQVENAEFDQDMSKLKLLDVGDVLGGKSIDDCRTNLSATVVELLIRGGLPFVIGGSNDLISSVVHGILNLVPSGNLSCITIGSHADLRVIDDTRFSVARTPGGSEVNKDRDETCDGRYVLFGAQVCHLYLIIGDVLI